MKGIWIIGTDTEIGKTTVAAALLQALRAEGLSPAMVKPVQTGVDAGESGASPEALAEAAPDAHAALRLGFPAYALRVFRTAASPALAAAIEGETIESEDLARRLDALGERHPETFFVLEGAGGLLVPLNDHETTLELVLATNLPVLLVVGNRLGCINHALLTLRALLDAGADVLGMVLNRAAPETSIDPGAGADAVSQRAYLADNAETLRRIGAREGVPLLASLPYAPGGAIDAGNLRAAARRIALAARSKDGLTAAESQRLESLLDVDRECVWHPYASPLRPPKTELVLASRGRSLRIAGKPPIIDGTSSWWCAMHGYGHPKLVRAVQRQAGRLSHVMFGGLTHEPAVRLAERLLALHPGALRKVFFSDSGSVSIEVAEKLAIQYWRSLGRPEKSRFLVPMGGYHGDTQGAMAVCDPLDGMHALFRGVLREHRFIERPSSRFDAPFDPSSLDAARRAFEASADEIAAVVLEPIVQGAGGMWFYHPEYLQGMRALCDEFDALLIVDEIATGFGRTGRAFASEWAGVSGDIVCVGKGLTGGMTGLAATLAAGRVAETIGRAKLEAGGGLFMHGPTFMANPLACAAALASLELFEEGAWREAVPRLEACMKAGLEPLRGVPGVADVRVLGAIGVVECERPVRAAELTEKFVRLGVWLRPFGRLIYMMPAFTTTEDELERLLSAVRAVVREGGFC